MCVVVVVVSGGGGGGGGQDVISIQTSTMTRYRLQYHVCRPVLAARWGKYKCISFSQRLLVACAK